MYSLVIVESPAKCNKIEQILGSGFKCIASYGHLRELKGLESIDIDNNFKPTFIISESKKSQVSKIKKLIKGAREVILASDDDREGEAIAWHICDIFKLPVTKTRRIIFHEITETAIKNAVQNTTFINMDKVYAQLARQILDITVGFKLSPILWSRISYNTKSSLSAGRCQSPALRLIYDNQKEINDSPGRKVYNTSGYFTSMNLEFVLNYNHEDEEKMTEFLESTVNFKHIYNCGKEREVKKNPPEPYTTSTLQQAASNVLRLSPKTTMALCQKLYEGGYITYMRTDSKTYSKDFIDNVKKNIVSNHGDKFISKDIDKLSERSVTEKKESKKKEESKAQEAHEAIRPTDIDVQELDSMGAQESKLYKLIWKNTMESCMPPAVYNSLTATVSAPEDNMYKYSSEQVVFPGWKVVGGYEKVSKEYAFLKSLKNNVVIQYKKVTSKVSIKDLKSRYTEAKLVQALEKKGIGRPSTFSSLIDKIQDRGYVTKANVEGKDITCIDFELEDSELSEIENIRKFGGEKNKMIIQPLGVLVIEFLINNFEDLFQYEYTSKMENKLDEISNGNMVWHSLCRECLNDINEQIKIIGIEDNRIEFDIDDNHKYMIAKYGPVIKYTNGDDVKFYSVKEDIDIEKLRNKEYKLDDIIIIKNNGRMLGLKDDKQVILKEGKYGKYIEWGDEKRSVNIEKDFDEIQLEDLNGILQQEKGMSVIRVIDNNTSIRKGKKEYSDYVFHKKPSWKKPKFISLDKFVEKNGEDSYKVCSIVDLKDWLNDNHKLKL